MEKIRVLIVDDSPTAQHGLRGILQRYADIEVVGEATSGFEAMALAEQLEPNVILMDAQMPGMDGVEATRRIKERLPLVQLLLLTVHARYIESALEAGADGYLLKDSGRQELERAVRRLGRRG